MEDEKIIDLYWSRSEEAISQTASKYGIYCRNIAWNILYNDEDSEECVNDAYLRAWNAMPPQRPCLLQTFLGKITRNLSLDRWRKQHAEKRDSGVFLVLEELTECISDSNRDMADDLAIRDTLNEFLRALKPEHRNVFLQRYWYLCSIRDISENYHISESKVKMILLRTREKLKTYLEKEGIL